MRPKNAADLREEASKAREQSYHFQRHEPEKAEKYFNYARGLELLADELEAQEKQAALAEKQKASVKNGKSATNGAKPAVAKPATRTGILTTLIQKSWKWIFLVALITLVGNILSAGAARFFGVADYFSFPWGWIIKWASLGLVTSMTARFSVGQAATVISILSLASCVFGFFLGTTMFLWLPGYFWMKNKLFNHK